MNQENNDFNPNTGQILNIIILLYKFKLKLINLKKAWKKIQKITTI